MWRVEKNTEYVSKTFRLPLELVSKMEDAAAKNGVSLNRFVFQSLNYALDNLETDEEIPEEAVRFENSLQMCKAERTQEISKKA